MAGKHNGPKRGMNWESILEAHLGLCVSVSTYATCYYPLDLGLPFSNGNNNNIHPLLEGIILKPKKIPYVRLLSF